MGCPKLPFIEAFRTTATWNLELKSAMGQSPAGKSARWNDDVNIANDLDITRADYLKISPGVKRETKVPSSGIAMNYVCSRNAVGSAASISPMEALRND
jgi:hypothetical protein